MAKRGRKTGTSGIPAWTPFERATKGLRMTESGPEEIEFAETDHRVWLNSRYQVHVFEHADNGLGLHGITWLSIKNVRNNARHDWRDFQRVKNELCGTEREAVEIYPAESRLHDGVDQFHLWVFPEGVTFPLGFALRRVNDIQPLSGSQRRFPPDNRPADCMSEEEWENLDPHVEWISNRDQDEEKSTDGEATQPSAETEQ